MAIVNWVGTNVPTLSLILIGVAAFSGLFPVWSLLSPSKKSEPLTDIRFEIKRGNMQDLVADKPPVLSYSLQPVERDLLKELWHWYDAQHQNPQQYVFIDFFAVDCQYLRQSPPLVRLWVRIHNYHTVPLKVTSLRNATLTITSNAFPGSERATPSLTQPSLDWVIERGSGREFYIDVEVHQIELRSKSLKDLILYARTRGDTITWAITGTWRGDFERYGEHNRELKSGTITYESVPTEADS